jgi:hypothetical protein
MPTITFTVCYDGSDPDILLALGRMASALRSNESSSVAPSTSASAERIATKFWGNVARTPRLKAVLEAWVRRNGKIPLTELVRISGVSKQHDYSGIGSALTRNMKKAGGGKDWYDCHQDTDGNWIYQIAAEYVAPLKRAAQAA